MGYEIPISGGRFSPKAATAIVQFAHVKLSADNTVSAITADTDLPCGVAQEAVTLAQAQAGKEVGVVYSGISKVVNGTAGALAFGVRIGPDATGLGIAAATGGTHYISGQVIEGAAAVNGVMTVMVNCATPTLRV